MTESHDEPSLEKPTPEPPGPERTEVMVDVGGRRLLLACYSFGAGRDVVLLHGIPGGPKSWFPTAARLAGRYRVWVPALLGFDASSRPNEIALLRAEGQAEALDRGLAELGVSEAVVVGHDFGGPVAVRLVARNPRSVRGLGVLATNLFPDTPIPFPLSTISAPVVGAIARAMLFSRPSLAMMLRQGMGRPAVALAKRDYLGDRAQSRAIGAIFADSLRNLGERYAPIEAELAKVQVPTFVGWGTRDPFFPIAQGERAAKALRTELRVYDDAGHFLPEERPDEITADLSAFVAGTQDAVISGDEEPAGA